MSAQHTPGPWAYVRNPESTRWIIDSEPAHAIACTAGFEPDNEANARLIAAAPELLEALEELAERAGAFNVSGVYFDEPSMTAEVAALQKAYAAIAKARGIP